jgi:hypothetical protein
MINTPYYHGIVRKLIVSFGQLFTNIKIQRFNNQDIIEQLIDVPISYGNKEKWYQRLREEKDTDQRVLISLPRIGYEITGLQYDPARKINKMTQYRACQPTLAGNYLSAFAPVPYNVQINLYVMTKTLDDMYQIVEQILPFFGPQYNLTINAIPKLDIKLDIPITMNGIDINDSYEGPMENRREVVATLTFTAKTEFLGQISDDNANGIITKVITKIDPQYGETARQVQVEAIGDIPDYVTIEDFFDIPRPI